MTNITGGCHCGAVRYTCTAEPLGAGHCQCSDCRKLSGTGHNSGLRVPFAAFSVQGAPKGYVTHADSGNELTRYFCGNCGSPVYSRSTGTPDIVVIRAGSLDDPSRFQPQTVIWTSSAVSWDVMDPALKRFDKAAPRPRK
jgi:hypothetical protein